MKISQDIVFVHILFRLFRITSSNFPTTLAVQLLSNKYGKTGASPSLNPSNWDTGNPNAFNNVLATCRLLTTSVIFCGLSFGLYAISGTLRSCGRNPPWSSNSNPTFHKVPTSAPMTRSGTLGSRDGEPKPASATSSPARTYEIPRVVLARRLALAVCVSEAFASHILRGGS